MPMTPAQETGARRRRKVAVAACVATGLAVAAPAGPAGGADGRRTIAVIGDSLGFGLQNGLYRVVPKSVRLVRAARHNTGLTRIGIYDWAARVGDLVRRHRVDVLVVFLGANDYQRIVLRRRGGFRLLRAGRPAWVGVYRARVGRVVENALKAGARRVVWVGLPIVRDAAQDRRYRLLNSVYRTVAAAHPAVGFFPTRRLSAGRTRSGALVYRAYITVGKRRYLFRNTGDGIHFTSFGYRYLAHHLWRVIAPARR